jgi:hypothetical protein
MFDKKMMAWTVLKRSWSSSAFGKLWYAKLQRHPLWTSKIGVYDARVCLIHGYASSAASQTRQRALRLDLKSLIDPSESSTDGATVNDRITRERTSLSKSAASAALQQMSIEMGQPDETDMTASVESSSTKSNRSNDFVSGLGRQFKSFRRA